MSLRCMRRNSILLLKIIEKNSISKVFPKNIEKTITETNKQWFSMNKIVRLWNRNKRKKSVNKISLIAIT